MALRQLHNDFSFVTRLVKDIFVSQASDSCWPLLILIECHCRLTVDKSYCSFLVATNESYSVEKIMLFAKYWNIEKEGIIQQEFIVDLQTHGVVKM